MIRNYTFYKIVGMSFVLIPKIFAPELNNTANIRSIEIGSFLNSTAVDLTAAVAPSDTDIKNAKDFTMYTP